MRFASVVIAMMICGPVTQAAPITFEFTGVVTSVTDPDHDLDGLVAAGSAFSGQYTFESTTAPLSPDSGNYQSATGSVAVTVGALQIHASAPQIRVIDDPNPVPSSGDLYTITATSAAGTPGPMQIIEFFPINFYYPQSNIFSSRILPLSPPPVPESSWVSSSYSAVVDCMVIDSGS